jgi:transposase
MARHIRLQPHLTVGDLEHHYRAAKDPVERSRWQMLWLLARGHTATAIAVVTGYSAYWIGQIAHRYNTQGPAGVQDRRHHTSTGRPLVPAALQEELRQALAGPAPDSDDWTGRTVAEWLSAQLGRTVPYWTGWSYLRRLGMKPLQPRPRHVQADAGEQEAFKGGSGRLPARSRPPSLKPLSRSGPTTSIASASSRS